jgi:hypothetical protein
MFGNGTKTFHGITGRNKETGAPVKSRFDNAMCAHVWAQGTQTFGQSSNGNLYFHGRALFSYRNTAPIGWLLPDGAALISQDSYSISTNGHQWDARRAARGAIYSVPDLDDLLREAGRTPAGGEVNYCLNFEARIDSALSDRAHVRRYVAARIAPIGNLSEESARALLARCGLARSLDKIRRDAIAKAERAKRAARKAEQKAAIDRLKGTAKIYRQGAAAMAENLAGQATQWQLHAPESTALALIEAAQKRIRKARGAAGKASTPAPVWRDAWRAHQALPDLAPDLARAIEKRARALSLADRRAARRRLVRAFRLAHSENFGTRFGAEDSDFEKASAIVRACEKKARTAADLAQHLHGPLGAGRTSFAALSARLDRLSAELDDFARCARASESFAALRAEFDRQAIERKAREIAEREAREAQARADWLAGLPVDRRPYFSRDNGAAYVRAVNVERDSAGNITGGTLETSQGADVPLVAAIRAFRFIKLVRARGQSWHRNGARVPVGNFQVDSIQPTGDFVAGCHKFDWRDVESLALSLGVADLAPDDSAVVRPARAA